MDAIQVRIPSHIQKQLLSEAGYRCSNPTCKALTTQDASQFDYVFQAGVAHIENLLALCGDCHQQYHGRRIPQAALQAWKILQIALAGNIEERSMDLRIAAIHNHQSIAPFFPDEHLPFPFTGGIIYLNIKESHMMLARALGIYEPDKTRTIHTLLKPGMTFIDIGSNKGDFSLLAAKIVGDTGAVLAFEPEPDNCCWIRRSMNLNSYKNVALYDIALGDINEPTRLYLGEKSGWHSLMPSNTSSSQGAIDIQMRTLDAVLGDIGRTHVDMIKIDVEGAELRVLDGARITLSNNEEIVLLIDIHPHLGIDLDEVCNFLRGHGFSIRDMKPPHHKLGCVGADYKEIFAKRL
ncbi:MAG TPA: FkbM family methyltransferase [Gammaproteobacteria bacterium]|nr:FkbM family methyltransferase [Gammaproteobacteria bacterium]